MARRPWLDWCFNSKILTFGMLRMGRARRGVHPPAQGHL